MDKYFCTYLLILINVIVFFLIRQGKLETGDLGVSYHLVHNRHEYSRIITSAFTHEEPMHLLFNMIALYNTGTFVESYYGHLWMLVIYFVSIILGELLALQIRHNRRDDYTMSIGASGGICGLDGTYFMLVIYYYGLAGLSYLIRPMASLIMVSMMPGVDGTAHFSCMAAGMAITLILIFLGL